MRLPKALVAFFALGLSVPTEIIAQNSESETFSIDWLVVPKSGSAEKRWIDKFYPLALAEVRPTHAFNLEKTYTDKFIDGAIITSKTPLALTDRAVPTACVASAWEYEKGGTDVPCFADEDRDGRFEHVFQIETGATPVPLGRYKVPKLKRVKKIDPIAYVRNPNNILSKPLYVFMTIDETQTSMLGKSAYFMFCATPDFGENGRLPDAKVCYGSSLRVPKPVNEPTKFYAFGGEFLLHRIETTLPGWGGGGATITTLRPFKSGPFFQLLYETLNNNSR